MANLLFGVIGVITSLTLDSCGITINMWQFWVIVCCLIATMTITTDETNNDFKE